MFWVCGRVLWCGRSRVRCTRVDCEISGLLVFDCGVGGCVILRAEFPEWITLTLAYCSLVGS